MRTGITNNPGILCSPSNISDVLSCLCVRLCLQTWGALVVSDGSGDIYVAGA